MGMAHLRRQIRHCLSRYILFVWEYKRERKRTGRGISLLWFIPGASLLASVLILRQLGLSVVKSALDIGRTRTSESRGGNHLDFWFLVCLYHWLEWVWLEWTGGRGSYLVLFLDIIDERNWRPVTSWTAGHNMMWMSWDTMRWRLCHAWNFHEVSA